MSSLVVVLSTARSAVALGRDRELSFLAAGVAFFAFFSLFPAVLLALAVGLLVGGEQFAAQIILVFETYLSQEGEAVLDEALAEAPGLLGFSIVGVVALLWSVFKVFRSLDIAFDRIYQRETRTPISRQLLNALVTAVAIGAGVSLVAVVRLLDVQLEAGPTPRLLEITAAIVGLTIAVVPMYYVMPPVPVTVSAVLPGTITAVAGLVVLQELFQLYTAQAGQYQAYGFIGAVLLFLLWLYFSALVLLFGAVLNAALAEAKS